MKVLIRAAITAVVMVMVTVIGLVAVVLVDGDAEATEISDGRGGFRVSPPSSGPGFSRPTTNAHNPR